MDVHDWLLASDPAVRWQAMRDLTDAAPDAVAAERAKVATEGWGAQLLAARDPDGQWAGGACFPASGWDRSQPQPWTATLPSLALLADLGLDPSVDVASGVAAHTRWEYDGAPFFHGEVEPCINGRTLRAGAYFGADVDRLAEFLLGDQLGDGGWNCEAENGATVSSFASTINVLEGLLAYEHTGHPEVAEARKRGEEYLLERGLMRRRSTGELVDEEFLRFAFPEQWHYDVLRGLDHFRAVGSPPDPRLAEALELVRSKQLPDGRWAADRVWPGAVHVEVDGAAMTTLRALRVLRWAG